MSNKTITPDQLTKKELEFLKDEKVTINEVRQAFGLDPVDGLDVKIRAYKEKHITPEQLWKFLIASIIPGEKFGLYRLADRINTFFGEETLSAEDSKRAADLLRNLDVKNPDPPFKDWPENEPDDKRPRMSVAMPIPITDERLLEVADQMFAAYESEGFVELPEGINEKHIAILRDLLDEAKKAA